MPGQTSIDLISTFKSLSSLQILTFTALGLAALPVLFYLKLYYKFRLTGPLRRLPRVDVSDANRQRALSQPGVKEAQWMKSKDSKILTWKNDIGLLDLYIADPKALHSILVTNVYRWPFSEGRRRFIANALGNGILAQHGETHRRQRRAMNPAFSVHLLKPLVSTFFQTSRLLMLRLDRDASLSSKYPPQKGSKVVNIDKFFSAATLDIIGLTGFSFNYNSLSGGGQLTNLLTSTGSKLLPKTMLERRLLPKLKALSFYLPFLGDTHLLRSNRAANILSKESGKEAKVILEKKFKNLKEETAAEGQEMKDLKKSDSLLEGQDMVDHLVKLSLASDVKATEKLYMDELIPLLSNLTSAGAETTSTLLSGLMVNLGKRSDVQKRLQKEIDELYSSLGEDVDPDWDGINSLSLLDNVINEGLRLNSPVPYLNRVSTQDELVPLSTPIIDMDGKKVDHITVKKGTNVILGLVNVNRSREIYGEDAEEFNPDRWDHLGSDLSSSNFLPHWKHYAFSHGAKACIGSRFSVVEAKCLLATVLRKYSVEPVVETVWKQPLVTSRVSIKGREHEGPQNPVRLIERI